MLKNGRDANMKLFGVKVPKTLARIFLSIAISMMALIIVIANILYINYDKIGIKTAYDFNIKYLRQVSHNITYINDFVKRYCVAQFNSPDMQKFIYSREMGDELYFDFIRSIGELQNSTLVYPMIHTVVVYNGFQDKVYSTSSMEGALDKELNDIFKQPAKVPVLQPIPRIITTDIYSRDQNSPQKSIKLLTFFMTEYESSYNLFKSAFAVNVNTEWIFNNLKSEITNESKLMLVDYNGIIIADESNSIRPFEQIDEQYMHGILDQGENGGSFVVQTLSGKKVVTCLKIPEYNWILVNEQNYDSVSSHLNQVRNYTILAVIGFVLLALIAASFVSKSIYNPIRNVVNEIRGSLANSISSQGSESDTEYIQKAFDISMQQIRDLEKYKNNTRDVLKENLIKTLLIDSTTPMLQLSEENMEDISSLLVGEGIMSIILLKIDQYSAFSEADSEHRKLTRFIIANSLSEKFADSYLMDVVPMGNGEFVVVLNLGQKEDDNHYNTIRDGIAEVQDYVRKMTGFSFSAFISETAAGKDKLYRCYRDLNQVVKYKMMYGPGCILNQKDIEDKEKDSKGKYPQEAETKIMEALKSENLSVAINEFDRFITQITKMNIDNFMASLSRLALSIDRIVNQINMNRIGEISISFNDFYGKLLSMENIEDIKADFNSLINAIVNQQKAVTNNRGNHIVSSILEYIQQDYGNKNLTLKDIASKIKMSYGYLSVTFKESTNMSLAEYLNEYRLNKAAEFLRITDYSVLEIMDKVGYDNESKFYRLFKKYYGTTPREYRLNTGLQKDNRSN